MNAALHICSYSVRAASYSVCVRISANLAVTHCMANIRFVLNVHICLLRAITAIVNYLHHHRQSTRRMLYPVTLINSPRNIHRKDA